MQQSNFTLSTTFITALFLSISCLNAMQEPIFKNTRNDDLISALQKAAPHLAVLVKVGLPFDYENGLAMSYQMDNGIADPETKTPASVYVASFVKAAGCYLIWQKTKESFEKVTGQPLAIPIINSNRYKPGSLKHHASTIANVGIEATNLAIDLAGPLGISYLTNLVEQSIDEKNKNN